MNADSHRFDFDRDLFFGVFAVDVDLPFARDLAAAAGFFQTGVGIGGFDLLTFAAVQVVDCLKASFLASLQAVSRLGAVALPVTSPFSST